VYKAVANGDMRKARSLQKLILKSQSARFIAIRQVTQLNAGKRTAGVDGKKSLNHKERFELNENIKDGETSKATKSPDFKIWRFSCFRATRGRICL
jgi:retron-type reverse transcriptase